MIYSKVSKMLIRFFLSNYSIEVNLHTCMANDYSKAAENNDMEVKIIRLYRYF